MRNKYIYAPKRSAKRLSINSFRSGVDFTTDEAVMNLATAKDCYNFDFSQGALREGYGIIDSGIFAGLEIKAIWLFKRFDQTAKVSNDRLIAVDVNGFLYEADGSGEIKKVSDLQFLQTPIFINYRLYGEDVVFLCSPLDGMIVYNGVSAPYKVADAPNITSMALHGERLFVTVDGEKNSVWFSDDLDPTNWDTSLSGGGFIQLVDERGNLNKVISFLGYVYVFRDYGITRINAIGAQTDFSVSNLFVSGGRIYSNTVTLCGDHIIFLAEDGLYRFDGVSTSRLLSNLDGLIINGDSALGTYASGKYYLAFERERNDDIVGCEIGEYINNGLLVVDLSKNRYALGRGMDLRSFCVVDGKVIAIEKNGRSGFITKCGSAFGEPLPKRWKLPKTDMGVVEKKRVKEIYIFTKSPLTLTLNGDSASKVIELKGSDKVQRKRVSFSDRRIGVDIRTDSATVNISKPSFTIATGGF